MLIYHLDLNGAMLKEGYIKELFVNLKSVGFDAVTIEIADKLIFPSNKLFAAPEAYDAKTWYDIIGYGIEKGLVIYPLLQTLGHLDHILRHEAYHHLAENIGKPYLMCPSNSKSLPFLYELMDDLKEVFHNPERIHLGGDEFQTAFKNKSVTKCPGCKNKDQHKMQIMHLSSLAKKALSIGMTPEIWGDDVLRNPGSYKEFPKETVFIDWFYDRTTQYQEKTGHIWGHLELVSKPTNEIQEKISKDKHCLMPYLLNEKGEFNNYYGVEYFVDNGVRAMVCSGVRSGYDSFAVSRTQNSIKNVSVTREMSEKTGVDHLVSSWSIRRNHPETTWPGILSATREDVSLPNLTQTIGSIPEDLAEDLFRATDAVYAIDHLNADAMRFRVPFYYDYLYYMDKYSSADEFSGVENKLLSRIESIKKIVNHLSTCTSEKIICSRKAHYVNGLELIQLRCEEDLAVIRLYAGVDPDKEVFRDLVEKSQTIKKEFIEIWSLSTPPHSLKQEVDIKFGYYEKVIGSLLDR